MTGITEQIRRLKIRIEDAMQVAGRAGEDIRLVGVAKRVPAATVDEAIRAGLTDIGESYVQEAAEKMPLVATKAAWHFIGQVQSNKTRLIAEHFDWVHTVTTARTAERLSRHRPAGREPLHICIQLKPHGPGAEERSGADAVTLADLAAQVADLPGLRLRGLMIVPVAGLAIDDVHREFARARESFEKLLASGLKVDTLSMGMSQDFEAAIKEGSTMLRIGTAVFGPRVANRVLK